MSESVSIKQYFAEHGINGRAAIYYKRTPDDMGLPRLDLWICRVRDQFLVCNDPSAEELDNPVADGVFLERFAGWVSMDEVTRKWEIYRRSVLADKKRHRKKYVLKKKRAESKTA